MVVTKVWGHVPVRRLTIVGSATPAVPPHLFVPFDVTHEDIDNHDRDDLRSPTYFDAAKYPAMSFESTQVTPKDAKTFVVTGNLTIKNVTKPVTFPVQIDGAIPGGKGPRRLGYNAQLQIDRRDWSLVAPGLTPADVLLVGYTVDISLTGEKPPPTTRGSTRRRRTAPAARNLGRPPEGVEKLGGAVDRRRDRPYLRCRARCERKPP